MPLPQTKLREIIFQLLYSWDTGRTEEQSSVVLLSKELEVARSGIYQALLKASAIQENLKDIDQFIKNSVQGYAFERIQTVERNILRLAIFEIAVEKIIPPKVSISEAMRLARKFSTPESASFINAILDNIYKTLRGEVPERESIEQTARKKEAQEIYSSQFNINQPIDSNQQINNDQTNT